jgi:hypothetical protein
MRSSSLLRLDRRSASSYFFLSVVISNAARCLSRSAFSAPRGWPLCWRRPSTAAQPRLVVGVDQRAALAVVAALARLLWHGDSFTWCNRGRSAACFRQTLAAVVLTALAVVRPDAPTWTCKSSLAAVDQSRRTIAAMVFLNSSAWNPMLNAMSNTTRCRTSSSSSIRGKVHRDDGLQARDVRAQHLARLLARPRQVRVVTRELALADLLEEVDAPCLEVVTDEDRPDVLGVEIRLETLASCRTSCCSIRRRSCEILHSSIG